jgi:hypothetical protein
MSDACQERYAYTFVCDGDIAFEYDGWCNHASWRKCVQGMVLYDLMMRDIEYRVVGGTLGERVEAVSRVREAGQAGSHTARYSRFTVWLASSSAIVP